VNTDLFNFVYTGRFKGFNTKSQEHITVIFCIKVKITKDIQAFFTMRRPKV